MRSMMWVMAMAATLTAFAAQAQDNRASNLDRAEVVGSRIRGDYQTTPSMPAIPAIAIARKGDYLLQAITLANDTRSAEGRSQEIHATIAKMVEQAGTRYQLMYGDANRIVLDRSAASIELEDESGREDASTVTLYVRGPVPADPAAGDAAILALRNFVKGASKVGRTEIEMRADAAIGMDKPEKYRYELIRSIADDSSRVEAALGNGCKVEFDGLGGRIVWQRISAIELLLYIPYTVRITGCSGAPARE